MGRAKFSRCGQYRYWLERDFNSDLDDDKTLLIIGLNPSTATAKVDDPTIRRCMGFAKSWGFNRLWVANLFAFRSTDPNGLLLCADPIGPRNNIWLKKLSNESDMTLVAWGNWGLLNSRDQAVNGLLKDPYCLGTTTKGAPRHPLYVKASTKPIPYKP